MPKKYPPLSYSEVIAILKERGFIKKDQEGSHEQYEAVVNSKTKKVTVDKNDSPYNDFIIKSMIGQSGLTREEFYTATKTTAKKINLKRIKDLESLPDEIS